LVFLDLDLDEGLGDSSEAIADAATVRVCGGGGGVTWVDDDVKPVNSCDALESLVLVLGAGNGSI